jgi:hypothetical protein
MLLHPTHPIFCNRCHNVQEFSEGLKISRAGLDNFAMLRRRMRYLGERSTTHHGFSSLGTLRLCIVPSPFGRDVAHGPLSLWERVRVRAVVLKAKSQKRITDSLPWELIHKSSKYLLNRKESV